MKQLLILLPIFFLAIVQGAFLPINLVLLTILLYGAFTSSAKKTLEIAFIGGLFLDLTRGNLIGLSSLFLISATFLLILYSRRFDPCHPIFLGIFIGLVGGLEIRIFQGFFDWKQVILLGLLAFGGGFLLRFFSFPREKIKI